MYHYGILFAVIILVVIVIQDISWSEKKTEIEFQKDTGKEFERAIDGAVNCLFPDEFGTCINSAQTAFDTLTRSLYVSFLLMENIEERERLQYYIPIFAVADHDGLYFYHYEEDMLQHKMVRIWTEKIPYQGVLDEKIYQFTLSGECYEIFGEDKVQVKEVSKQLKTFGLETISLVIEQQIEKELNEYNLISSQYGITYEFFIPPSDTAQSVRAVRKPSLIVLFEGYPLNKMDRMTPCFSIAGASQQKHTGYVITKEGWYYQYHDSSCECIKELTDGKKAGRLIYARSKKECAQLGAFPCSKCIDQNKEYDFLKHNR